MVRPAGRGDESAFAALYERYRGDVLRLCRQRIRDPGRAEDLTQETFLRALAAASAFRRGRPVWPWLATIARNLCIDELRAGGRMIASGLAVGEHVAAPDSTADTVVERAERTVMRRRLAAALSRIDQRHRRIVWLHAVEERSLADIARAHGSSVHAIRNASWRARVTLQRMLELSDETMRVLVWMAGVWGLRGFRRARSSITERAERLRAGMLPGGVAEQFALAAAMLVIAVPGHDPGHPKATRAVVTRAEHAIQARPHGVPAAPLAADVSTSVRGGSPASTGNPPRDDSPVRPLVETDRRDGAAAPHATRLRVEIFGPDGAVWLGSETVVECDPRSGDDLLPDPSPARTDC